MMKNHIISLMVVVVIAGALIAGCSAPSGPATPTPTTPQTTVATPSATTPQTLLPTSTIVPATTMTAPPSQEVTVEIVAKGFAFNITTLTVPAGAKVVINFDNQDSGIPHNVAFYETSAAQKSIFVGQRITGPAKTAYTFTAPSSPGTYFFRCDVHPSMNGNFVVT